MVCTNCKEKPKEVALIIKRHKEQEHHSELCETCADEAVLREAGATEPLWRKKLCTQK